MENTVLSFSETEKTQEISNFSTLIETVAKLGALQNINIKTLSESAPEKLALTPLESLRQRNLDLRKYVTILQETTLGRDLSNKAITKNVLDFMKLSTSEDMLNTITEEDIVEIYSPECIQIFRNFKFYETTTYSLSDLLLYDWSELYYRPSQVFQKIQVHIDKVLKTDHDDLVSDMADVPTHIIKEIKANPIQLCEIRFKKIAPVTDRAGRRAGLIVTCQAQSLLSSISHQGIDFI